MKKFSILCCLLGLITLGCQEASKTEQEKTITDYSEWAIVDFHEEYKKGTTRVTDVVQFYVDRIQKYDQAGPQLQSVLFLNPEWKEIASKMDAQLEEGMPDLPLFGIPVLIKDNINTAPPMPTTAGSRALEGNQPPVHSPLVQQLIDAGALILGKANLSEWANFRGKKSTSGWSALGGQTKNPYDPAKNPCGSSSGSGVAVSANLTALAIGTETNGSIVCPSHANGIVGIKPTVGLVSRTGIIPISFTQDIAGPMCRTVADAAQLLSCMTRVDSLDSKMLQKGRKYSEDYTAFLDKESLKGKRIGMWTQPKGVVAEVDSLYEQAVDQLEELGATVIPIDSISADATSAYSFEIMLYEYKDGLNKYFASLGPQSRIHSLEDLIAFNKTDSVELSFYGQEYLIAAEEKGALTDEVYLNALSEMKRLSQAEGIDRVLQEQQLDAIIAPTGSPAWTTTQGEGDNYILGTSSPAAQAGYPAVTVPMGFVDGLPVGLSFFSTAWTEGALIGMAYSYEQATNFRKAPELQ